MVTGDEPVRACYGVALVKSGDVVSLVRVFTDRETAHKHADELRMELVVASYDYEVFMSVLEESSGQ